MDPKDILKKVEKQTKGKVSQSDILNLAGNIKPNDAKDERALRNLILQVSAMANVPVSEDTINQIVTAIKQSGLDPNNMEQMLKMIAKGK